LESEQIGKDPVRGGYCESEFGVSLRNFWFGEFEFRIRAATELDLPPYKGSTFRGALGHALRKLSCRCGEDAEHTCAYGYLMESSALHAEKTEAQSPPHPLILEPVLDHKQIYTAGEEMFFKSVLIGNAIDYLTYMVLAVHRMGETGVGRGRGEFILKSVEAWNLVGKETMYSADEPLLSTSPPRITWRDIEDRASSEGHVESVTLRFVTPLRFKSQGKLTGTAEMGFVPFMRNLLGRIARLGRYYCGWDERFDYRELVNMAEDVRVEDSDLRWRDWERYSSRQQTRMKLGGLLGYITFAGNLTLFLPYLMLGSHIHVGKNTVFGLGKYEVSRAL